jgi:limonene-1,2-epoxide hydrolase
MTPTQVFLEYIAACEARDIERVMRFYTPQSTYHNIPSPMLRGPEEIRSLLQGFFGMCSAVKFDVLSIAESPAGVVLTERIDRFEIAGEWRAIPVMGAVEIQDGKLLAWREYYDSRQMESAFAAKHSG